MIKAIIFDVDGTLIDTFGMCGCMLDAYRELYPKRAPALADFERCYSMTWQDSYRALDVAQSDWGKYRALVQAFVEMSEIEIGKPANGIYELTAELCLRGYRLGINTSRSMAILDETAKGYPELFRLFEPGLIVASDMISKPKPAPDSLQYLSSVSGIAPEDMLYIGDSLSDMLCARDAGASFCWAYWCRKDEDAQDGLGYPALCEPSLLLESLKPLGAK